MLEAFSGFTRGAELVDDALVMSVKAGELAVDILEWSAIVLASAAFAGGGPMVDAARSWWDIFV